MNWQGLNISNHILISLKVSLEGYLLSGSLIVGDSIVDQKQLNLRQQSFLQSKERSAISRNCVIAGLVVNSQSQFTVSFANLIQQSRSPPQVIQQCLPVQQIDETIILRAMMLCVLDEFI